MEFDAEIVMIPYHLYDHEDKDLIKSAMIEFARIHVERALKEVSESIIFTEGIDMEDIDVKDFYPLTNIK
jgi:hypothetical protein